MPFATDRDLLVHEPTLFSDVPFPGQERVVVADGQLTGTSLSSAVADFSNITPGMVALVGATPVEVIAVVNANTITVSRLRASKTDAAIAPPAGTGLSIVVRTFEPQLSLAHGLLLRQIGVAPADENAGYPRDFVTESMIVSRNELAHLTCLGALARIFAGAAAISGDSDMLWRKADVYQRRLRGESRGIRIGIDLDGDGQADLWREPTVIPLVRA